MVTGRDEVAECSRDRFVDCVENVSKGLWEERRARHVRHPDCLDAVVAAEVGILCRGETVGSRRVTGHDHLWLHRKDRTELRFDARQDWNALGTHWRHGRADKLLEVHTMSLLLLLLEVKQFGSNLALYFIYLHSFT